MASTKLDMARIQAAFDQCEQDADKCIDRKAVAKLFKRLGQSVGKKELDRMVKAADKNGDGKISYEEFCSLVASWSHHVDEDLRESFVLFDTNGDGFIDGPELKAAMKNFYALELTDADVEEMIAEADQDGNKKIDFNEFKTMMTAISQPAK